MHLYEDTRLHIGLETQLMLSDWIGMERLVATQAAARIERGHQGTIIARELRAKTVDVPPWACYQELTNRNKRC